MLNYFKALETMEAGTERRLIEPSTMHLGELFDTTLQQIDSMGPGDVLVIACLNSSLASTLATELHKVSKNYRINVNLNIAEGRYSVTIVKRY